MEIDAKHLPTIQVTWDQDKQEVNFGFNPQEFRDWDFIVMVLGGAHEKAKRAAHINFVNAMQQQEAAKRQHDAIASALRNGGLK